MTSCKDSCMHMNMIISVHCTVQSLILLWDVYMKFVWTTDIFIGYQCIQCFNMPIMVGGSTMAMAVADFY